MAVIAVALGAPSLVHAQQSGQYVEQAGPYTIHYSMVPTALLPDEVKQRHSLPDAGSALLNVAVRRDGRDLPAEIDTRITNLLGQPLDIDMRRLEENGLISYLGVVDISNVDALHVTMTIVPAGSAEPIELEFEERFLTR